MVCIGTRRSYKILWCNIFKNWNNNDWICITSFLECMQVFLYCIQIVNFLACWGEQGSYSSKPWYSHRDPLCKNFYHTTFKDGFRFEVCSHTLYSYDISTCMYKSLAKVLWQSLRFCMLHLCCIWLVSHSICRRFLYWFWNTSEL